MNTTEKPAGQNPWPIAIVALFVVFITFLVAFIVFAARQKVDLVSRDYYAEEIRFQQQMDRLKRTRPISAEIVVAYDPNRQSITLRLPEAQARRPVAGRIHLYRPSDSSLDRNVGLAVDSEGIQHVDARKLRSGLWKVRVEWRVDGEDFYFDQPIIVASRQS